MSSVRDSIREPESYPWTPDCVNFAGGIGSVRAAAKDRTMYPPGHCSRVVAPADNERFRAKPIVPGPRARVSCDAVIPYDAFNLPWVVAAAESCLNQVSADVVVHLVSDAVPPEQDEDIRRALRSERLCRFYRTFQSVGPYKITNGLLDYLETPYILIQDSDDLSSPNRAWRSVKILESGFDIFSGCMEQFVDRNHSDEVVESRLRSSPYLLSGTFWQTVPNGCLINGAMTVSKAFFKTINGFCGFHATGGLRVLQPRLLCRREDPHFRSDRRVAAAAQQKPVERVGLGRTRATGRTCR